MEISIYLILSVVGILTIVFLSAHNLSKKQQKYSETLKVGDVVSYRGKPAKILEIKDGKAKVETTVSLMQVGDKIDMDEYKFE